MKTKYSVSESEFEVLQTLWKLGGGPVKQSQLLDELEQEGKTWKRQTLNTFLFRLEQKGLVKRERRTVTAIYNKEDYNFLHMREMISCLYDGSFSDLVASFNRKSALSQEDKEELKKFLD